LSPDGSGHHHAAAAADAIAYGEALARQTFRREMNFLHLEAGHPELAQDWLDTPSKGRALFEQTRRAVVVDALSDGQRPRDSEIHARTIARLRGMATRASRPASGVRKTLPIKLTQVKFIGNGRRIRGFASTPDLDRQGDIIEPQGMAAAKLPLPLLWGHNADKPVGVVLSVDARRDGVWIEAELTPGIQLADDALKLIEARAIDAFSVGFRGLASEPLPGGGLRFTRWDLYEVSITPIPANPNARIDRRVGKSVKLVPARSAVRLVK
jgi:HK97 family phage prohead protease